MLSVNLIPAQRRQQRRVAARTAKWVVGGVLYLVLLTSAVCAMWLAPSPRSAAQSDLADLDSQITAINDDLARANLRLTDVTDELDAARAIEEQPDWSLLLGLVARSLGSDVVLERIELIPDGTLGSAAGPSTQEDDDGQPDQYRLDLAGFGRTQSSVSDCVLRLESMGVFRKVTIVQTQRVKLGQAQVVAFSLECKLEPRASEDER